MSKFGIAHCRASIYPSIIIGTVASPSQVLSYCSLAKPDSRTKSNTLAL